MAWQDRTALAEEPNAADEIILNDVSDTTDNAAGTVKTNTLSFFIGAVLTALKSAFTPASTGVPASLGLAEDTANGVNVVALTAPAAITANRVATFQDASGTVAYTEDLGSAAFEDVGPSEGNVVQFDATGYPTADGSQITNLTKANMAGLVESFADLDDVPLYAGNEGKALRINPTGTAVEAVADVLIDPSDNADGTSIATIGGVWVERTVAQRQGDLGITGLAGIAAAFTTASASGPAALSLAEDTDNGANVVAITAPAAVASNKVATLQDVTGTIYVTGGTDVAVADGGTGVSTLATGELVTGAGTSPVTTTAIPAGGLVGITATQTLTNKNLADATNTYRAASEAVTGAVELATAAEVTTGTDALRAVCPDQLAASDFGKRVVSVTLNGATALTTGDGKAYWRVPAILNGYNLVAAQAARLSGTGVPSFQVARIRAATPVDMLSTNITIDDGEVDSSTAVTPPVINATNDDVATADRLRFDVDASGTSTLWAEIQLTFQLP